MVVTRRGARKTANGALPDEEEKRIKYSNPDDPTTDLSRWRMKDDNGLQTWHYLQSDEDVAQWPQAVTDKHYIGLPTGLPELPAVKRPSEAIDNGMTFFAELQLPAGHWGCEYDGPMFLIPGLVVAWYITGTPVPGPQTVEFRRYLYNRQNEDGGWGLHTEGPSTVFGTSMNYVAMRMLGADKNDPRMARARERLRQLGGATRGPLWNKFWLCILGIMPWECCNPMPAELWLLPDWVPFAPWRWWIHVRMVFLPMSYLYSKRYVHPLTSLTKELREELYTEPYEVIKFAQFRGVVAPTDNYHPKTWILRLLMWLIVWIWNPFLLTAGIKAWAEAWTWELICHEDENSDFANLAPVNSPVNTIACYVHDGPDSDRVKRHIERLQGYLWLKPLGLMCSGTDGVQVWDTSFTILAATESGIANDPKWKSTLSRAHKFLDNHQIQEEVTEYKRYYRQRRRGAWPFSTRRQGYTVSDTTSESLKAVLTLQNVHNFPKLLSDQRIYDAVDVLLTMQNASGGFSSYEPTRGSEYLEMLNSAEVFGRIMIEYDYPECSTAVVTALSQFQEFYPDYRAEEIRQRKERALDRIRSLQRPDGSWYGSWGICFTYAAFFACESLASVGETYETSERMRRACHFLLSKQRDDGGWGESWRACEEKEYVQHEENSQVVGTSWACMALLSAEYPEQEPLKRAVTLLMERQQPNGEWLQESLEGVFNCTTMIAYPNYKFYFVIRALGMYKKRFGDDAIL